MKLAAQKIRRGRKLRILEEAQGEFEASAHALNARLMKGHISLATWEERMMDLVKDVNTGAYVAGKSGEWESMSFEDWGRTGRVIRDQYTFVRRWRRQLQADLENKSLAQLNARADLYAEAASQSFERGYQSEVGLDPNVLPAHPGDGTTACYARCRCRWAIRILDKAGGDFNATWRLGNAEHCETCRTRSRLWKQLRIRGNELVDGYEPIFANR